MKRAFSLLELLVVIGIIGILVGTLVSAFGGSTERARTVKCATNLKNLASAAIAESYPFAQSAQYVDTDTSRSGAGVCYRTHRGWISFLDRGTDYPLTSPGEFQQCSFAHDNQEELWYALTNGAIWKAIGGNHDCYLCPAFVDACHKAGVKSPGWSYQMSAYFGYEKEPGKALSTKNDGVNHPPRADRRLLFAEIPALELKSKEAKATGVTLPPVNLTGGNGTEECDCCLRYKDKGGNESIGFNHRRNRQIIGHVAFADGHVEAIAAPTKGNFVELTDWLCRALDVVYHDGSYEEVHNSNESEE